VIDCQDEIFIYAFNTAGMKLQKDLPFRTEGIKVNPNCEGILIRNSLFLPYSFLTFIIRERNATNELTEETFLMEGYMYRINRLNCFHHFCENFNAMQVCINGIRKENQNYLSMLLHPNEQYECPLGMAINSNNKRVSHLIMQSLATELKADSINIEIIKQHFKSLLEYQTFEEFLKNCFFQTGQMAQVESLNVNLEEGDRSLVDSHNTSFLDDGFAYKFTDSEKPQKFVIVKAIQANWMLTDTDGEEFLYALEKSENLQMF